MLCTHEPTTPIVSFDGSRMRGMSTDELLAQMLSGRFEEEAEARAAETLAGEEDDGELRSRSAGARPSRTRRMTRTATRPVGVERNRQ